MPDTDTDRLRQRIDRLDRRIARVELHVANVTGAASELQRAGLFDPGSTEPLIAELWQMVDRLKALRDGWAELHACMAGAGDTPVPLTERALH